jgi:hypothetical protein
LDHTRENNDDEGEDGREAAVENDRRLRRWTGKRTVTGE